MDKTLQPSKSSFYAYKQKYNLMNVGEKTIMDDIPKYQYDYNAYGSKFIQPKATGKFGEYYFDEELEENEKELENCLFNLKKKMRKNKAMKFGFEELNCN